MSDVVVKDKTNELSVEDQKIVEAFMNQWWIKLLFGFLPGGNVVREVITKIVEYVDTVERAVQIKGAGVAKKSIVEKATKDWLYKNFPILQQVSIIVDWVVDKAIDFIVDMKNKNGWDWIPIVDDKGKGA